MHVEHLAQHLAHSRCLLSICYKWSLLLLESVYRVNVLQLRDAVMERFLASLITWSHQANLHSACSNLGESVSGVHGVNSG